MFPRGGFTPFFVARTFGIALGDFSRSYKLERISVDSSMIKSLGYDINSQTLEVVFARGQVYHYEGVPAGVYEDVISADSVGKAFVTHVKTQGYPYKQL